MYQSHSILAIIPARSGSKGLPNKHLLDLGGKPLLAWTIAAAKGATLLDDVVFSSNDGTLRAVAEQWKITETLSRPDCLAMDDTRMADVVYHVLTQVRGRGTYDYIVLLQPTSPFRTAADIDACIRLCIDSNAPACISVCEAAKPWLTHFLLDESHALMPVVERERGVPRQQLPKSYLVNGAIYVLRTEVFEAAASFVPKSSVGFVMPRDRSCDIDEPLDLKWARFLLTHTNPIS